MKCRTKKMSLPNNIKLIWWYHYTYSATLSLTDTNVLTHIAKSVHIFHILKDLMDLFLKTLRNHSKNQQAHCPKKSNKCSCMHISPCRHFLQLDL